MATKLYFIFLIFIVFSLLLSQARPEKDTKPADIYRWCKHTPHPDTCIHYMGRDPTWFKPKCKAGFRTMAVQVAMERALEARGEVARLGLHCRSKRKKAAWKDCHALYDNTVFQLNRTLVGISSNTSCSEFDAQTWLSASLTNLETCLSGSLELNVSKFILPIVSNNVSELISNSLAVNANMMRKNQSNTHHQNGFPGWVTATERRLLSAPSVARRANAVVAKDGSARFRSIQAAINWAVGRRRGNNRVIIYVKRGIYRENIEISNKMNRVMLVGDGLRYTIITGSRSVKAGFTTYSSATVGVDGTGFIARGITFRNTAGPQNGQAVALRSASDLSVFYACSIEGYQDTLFVHAQRQFYKSCYIFGTIDFIFGNAAVVFQNCIIYVRRPLQGQANVITAQGRGDPFQNTGISIHNSRVLPAPDLRPVVQSFETYLGRPWQQYSRTVFLKTYLDGFVNQSGWMAWGGTNFAWDTVYYGEYMNFGPGASTVNRVKWKGHHVIRSSNVASGFTVANLIAGRSWLPATGVPFTLGL